MWFRAEKLLWFQRMGFRFSGLQIIKVLKFRGFWVTVEKVFQGFSNLPFQGLVQGIHRKEANKVGHFRIQADSGRGSVEGILVTTGRVPFQGFWVGFAGWG